MKRKKSAHSSSRKRIDEIINAALYCFSEKGFSNTSMADICICSGASTGSVYHHFKSKEHLAAAAYLSGIEIYQNGILEIFSEEQSPQDCIFSIVRYHITWINDNQLLANYLFKTREQSVYMQTEERLFELNKQFAAGVSSWLKKNSRAGVIRPVALDIFIPLLLGPCQEYSRLLMAEKAATKPDAAIKEIAGAVWKAIRPELSGIRS